jgi:UDP-3-O-[3-hydroxymyristoyl] glucosamine N-acyltransferase
MKLNTPIPVRDLAKRYNMKLIGNENQLIYGINEIHKVEEGDLTFVDVEKYYDKSIHSAATIILINKEVEAPNGKTLLITETPFDVYNQLVLETRPIIPQMHAISETAYIHPSAIIEANVTIGHYAVIGANSRIQCNSVIGEYSVIGNNVNIQQGVVIGSDAFYFKKTADGYKKWRSGGRVIIQDYVDIGSGCTINKGVSGDTIIGEGTKIDCLVQIGHGVEIGKHCLIASQVGIAGKTIIGDHCVFYGQVGITQNLIIGDRVVVLAKSGVDKNLETGKTYFGVPVGEVRSKMREMAALRILAQQTQKNTSKD